MEWISVEDRLPDKGVAVLCLHNGTCKDKGQLEIDRVGQIDWGVWDFLINYARNYSHWMPLPEPPGEG